MLPLLLLLLAGGVQGSSTGYSSNMLCVQELDM